MAVRKVYVVGDKKRLVMQALLRDMERAGLTVQVVEPNMAHLLPDEATQVVFGLSDLKDIQELRLLQDNAERKLYLVGTISGLSMADEQFLKQIAAAKFPSWTFDVKELLDAIAQNSGERKRVLVVDDEPIMLRSIKSWLDGEFDVSLVNSGVTAISFLEKHEVDLVLLDYEMPDMDGPELLGILRENEKTKQLPVIFLTSKDDRASILKVMELKPSGYLLKNRKPEEILASVQKFFKKPAAQ